jgi:membrane protease YdiL (CAAX protease family)
MWLPAFARFIATRTVDQGWHTPFPLGRWGRPRASIVLVPFAIISAIYVGAYALAWLLGIQTGTPVWPAARVPLNVAVNLPLLSIVGLLGSLGEELGWRGYLQPRLDQLHVPGSLLWVLTLETLFHVPLILLAGYLAGGTPAMSIALFFGLNLGVTPVWTWATYRWRSLWMAAWFHTFHNAISQVILPKALGAGDARLLGESGMLPVALYLFTAAVILATNRARGNDWRTLAERTVNA